MALHKSIHTLAWGLCSRNALGKLQHKSLSQCPQRVQFAGRFFQVKVSKTNVHPSMHRSFPIIQVSKSSLVAPLYPGLAARTTMCNLPSITQSHLFHTSHPKKAIPPGFWLLFRPIANVAAIYFGRYFKKLWQRMPPDKRDKVILKFKRNQNKIFGMICFLA